MTGRLTLTFAFLLTFFVTTEIGVSCFALGSHGGAPPSIKSRTASTAISSVLPDLRKQTLLSAAAAAADDEPSPKSVQQYIRGGDMLTSSVSKWPSNDALDKRLIKIALPCILNFAIAPLVGAVDLFWVNRMGNPLAVAGQAAANQVFNSAFWLASFLPSGTSLLLLYGYFHVICYPCG